MSLDEHRYAKMASRELNNLIDQIDELDPDEVEGFLSQGVLKLSFFNNASDVCVINSHGAAREIWMAHDAQAWHFGWDEEASAWKASKTGEELYEVVNRTLSQRLKRDIALERADLTGLKP